MIKIVSGLNVFLVVFYWIPFSVLLINSYDPGKFLSGLTILMITFAITSILVGMLGVIGLLRQINFSMVIVVLSLVAVKSVIDLIFFEALLFLYISLFFAIAAVLCKYVARYVPLRKQVLTVNILILLYYIVFIIQNGLPWEAI